MKLNDDQLTKALDQIEARAIPDTHPVMSELTDLFGDHTFFVDGQGLNIVEPANADGQQTAQVISLADWADASCTRLVPHEPKPTGIAIDLAA